MFSRSASAVALISVICAACYVPAMGLDVVDPLAEEKREDLSVMDHIMKIYAPGCEKKLQNLEAAFNVLKGGYYAGMRGSNEVDSTHRLFKHFFGYDYEGFSARIQTLRGLCYIAEFNRLYHPLRDEVPMTITQDASTGKYVEVKLGRQ